MNPTFAPPSPADLPTLYPPEPDAPGWQSWVPAPWACGAATLLLPPVTQSRSLPPIPYGALGPPTEVLPPPMLAPLEQDEPWLSPPQPAYLFPAAPAPASVPAPPPASIPAPPPPPTPVRLDLFPLDRCARIDAAIAHRPERAGEILQAYGLEADDWKALHCRYRDAIGAERRRGESALLMQYDAAYVAELERVRGRLTADDFAFIAQSSARGTRDEALAALDLPASAALPIQRAFLARAAEDPKLRASLCSALGRT